MLLPNKLDAEVVDHKCERDGAPVMFPKARCVGTFVVSMWCKLLAKEFVGQYAGLWETPYCSLKV